MNSYTDIELVEYIKNGNYKYYSYTTEDFNREAEVDNFEFERYLKHSILRINGFKEDFPFSHHYSTRFNLSKATIIKRDVKTLQFTAPLFYKDNKNIAVIKLRK